MTLEFLSFTHRHGDTYRKVSDNILYFKQVDNPNFNKWNPFSRRKKEYLHCEEETFVNFRRGRYTYRAVIPSNVLSDGTSLSVNNAKIRSKSSGFTHDSFYGAGYRMETAISSGDWVSTDRRLTRAESDEIFRQMLITENGYRKWRARLYWLGVRIFGWMFYKKWVKANNASKTISNQ